MLAARLLGLADKSRHPDPLTDADRDAGEALITVAERIVAAVDGARNRFWF
jgi:hypothetical protein